MKEKLIISKFTLLVLIAFQGFTQTNYLEQSWQQQVKGMDNYFLIYQFTESSNQLGHSFYPWQQTNYQVNGQIWYNSEEFSKLDTLKSGKHVYTSKTVLKEAEMLLLDFGNKDLTQITTNFFEDQTYKTARYSPARILNYFVSNKISISNESDQTYAIYETTINKTIVKLHINKHNNLLSKLVTISDDELFGDVETEYIYSNYTIIGSLFVALNIDIKKINGKILDQVRLNNGEITDGIPSLLERPENYKLTDEVPAQIHITTEKYNDNIYLLELKHTDDKILIVEFTNFLLVAEAPLNSENGELIIEEARKIAPMKPIRYFVFGHYHPHYLGGIRPFVQKGAKIITSKQNMEYVSFIVNAEHTINPDSLQIDPKPLVFEEIKDSLKISDGKTEMTIYFIGEKSFHTKDYLIYYFPNEKILFEDDLVWISKSGELKKASNRQAGLFNAIKDLGIEVKTIIQSWPVKDYGVKTVIPFEDLEKSVNIK